MEINVGTLLGAVVGGVVLFLWSGVTQNLPWGFKSVRSVPQAPGLAEAIGRHGADGMFFTTDGTSSLVVARPQAYYNMTRYFALEILTQAAAALVLTLILAMLTPLSGEQKLALVALLGLLVSVAVDFQHWNWWGFSTAYSLGMALNRCVGWVLAAWVLDRFVV